MEIRELIERELNEMRQKHTEMQAHLDQVVLELQQLAGAISFGEYLIEQMTQPEKAEEERS